MPNHTVPSTDSTQRLINAVRSLWEELHPGQHRSVALNSALERDLGFDSLARVELIARIEKSYDAKLPDEIFAQAETVQDLLQAVLAASTAATKSRSAIAPSPALPLPVARYPESAQTLVDVLDWHLRVHPDRMHVVFYATPDQVQSLPYGQLRSDTQQLAAGLDEHRLMPGQAVGIMLPTSLDFFRVFFGVLLAGGVPVPLYPPARRAQIEDHLRRQGKILANAAATLLITVPEVRLVSTYLLSNIRAWSRAADLTSEDGCMRQLAPALSRYGIDRYLVGDPVQLRTIGADVAAEFSRSTRAMVVGHSQASRHCDGGAEFCLRALQSAH